MGMGPRFAYLAACALCLAACALNQYSEPRASWRATAEEACLASGEVRASAYVQPASDPGGRGSCGMERPLKVSASVDGRVAITPEATINCPMTAAISRWIGGPVQVAARAHFGQPVVGITQIASYGCRGRNGSHFGPLSEHAFGNALDVAGFRLANGREIKVLQGWWHGTPQEQAFLHEVFAAACAEFYTVLGPGSDSYHSNHFHLDLLLTNASNGRHYCRPFPSRGPYEVPTAALGQAHRPSLASSPPSPLSFVGDGR
jgi:hypothetical protein